jgi:hypothetical protein
MFTLWAIHKGILFIPKEVSEDDEFKKWDLTSKAYIFMKRLGQDYNRFMMMDATERDVLFEMEMKLLKEEQKQNETKT